MYKPNEDEYISDEEYEEARSYGVSPTLLRDRIRKSCWEKKKAITTPPRVAKNQIITPELKSLAKEFGVSEELLRKRITRGWDMQIAATTETIKNPKEIYGEDYYKKIGTGWRPSKSE